MSCESLILLNFVMTNGIMLKRCKKPLFKAFFLSLAFLIAFTAIPIEIFGQRTNSRRIQERREQLIREMAERERALAEAKAPGGIPKPKAAVMNVDVQLVLSGEEHKTFAEAQKAPAKQISDGEPLWMYLRFNGKLGDYVLTQRDPEAPENLLHLLFAEIGPQGDPTSLSKYIFRFSKAELQQPEIRVRLAPGMPGRNASSPIFLDVAGTQNPGIWNSEIRLTNSTAMPRSPNENLAKTEFFLDLSESSGEYRRMKQEYVSMIIRGTPDKAQMPIPGSFYSLPIKTRVQTELNKYSIRPVRFYFASDDWIESGVSMSSPKQRRSVFAAFTYRSREKCFYGVAEVKESFDLIGNKYIPESIEINRDIEIPCAKLE